MVILNKTDIEQDWLTWTNHYPSIIPRDSFRFTPTPRMLPIFSNHSNKIKARIIIGFYLRAFRICSPQLLPEEENYIENTFKTLQYPNYFLYNVQRKAYKIHHRIGSGNEAVCIWLSSWSEKKSSVRNDRRGE